MRGLPPNKGMKLTKLSAAWLPEWTCRLMPAPPRTDAGTASQLIPGVRRTTGGVSDSKSHRTTNLGYGNHRLRCGGDASDVAGGEPDLASGLLLRWRLAAGFVLPGGVLLDPLVFLAGCGKTALGQHEHLSRAAPTT